MTRRRGSGRSGRVRLGLALALLGGCGGPPDATHRSVELLWDPRVTVLDAPAPHFDWGEREGSLLLGAGWSATQFSGPEGERRHFAWLLRGEAAFHVEAPPGGALDLYARCRPFEHEDAAPQSLTLVAGERELGPVPLEPGRDRIRIPLPEGWLPPGLAELRLRAAWAVRHSEVVEGSGDRRRFSASCSELGVAPRRLRNLAAFHAAAARRPEDDEITLPAGGALTLPLPPSAEVDLRLRAGGCAGCALAVEHERPDGGVRSLFRHPLGGRAAPVPEIRLGTGPGVGRLHLRAVGPAELAGEPAVRLEPGRDALRVRYLPRPAAPPPIFVYVVDTLRADALEPYGARRPTSPAIAAFAADAVVYENAWTASSWTLPATVSTLTGVLPQRHRVMKGDVKYSPDAPASLAARLGARGYRTVGVSQSFVVGPQFGVDVGFERFFLDDQLNSWELSSGRVRRYLLAWLRSLGASDEPVFAYLHTVDPHAPYLPPAAERRFAETAGGGAMPWHRYRPIVFMTEEVGEDPGEVAHLQALYDGEVRAADAEFGRFLDLLRYLGLYERSLVALVSDHGEEFGEHGGFDHGRTVYEEMLRVPLIVKYPGNAGAGTRVARRVSAMDLAATVLELVGAGEAVAELDGRPLPRAEGGAEERRAVFSEVAPVGSEHLEAVDYRAVAVGELKCVESRNGRDQFGRPVPPLRAFDLAEDPGELSPLAEDDPRFARCRELAAGWERVGEGGAEGGGASEEALDHLRALGYIE